MTQLINHLLLSFFFFLFRVSLIKDLFNDYLFNFNKALMKI